MGHPAACGGSRRGPHGADHAGSWVEPDVTSLVKGDGDLAAGGDVVLNGHDHDYERFAPQDPTGQAGAGGVRELVVGTGGAEHVAFREEPARNSEVRESSTFGVLRLALHDSSYGRTFVPEAGQALSDSGSSACHASPARAPP